MAGEYKDGQYYDDNGIPHAVIPSTVGFFPPEEAAPAPTFQGTPSQVTPGYSGVSPMRALPSPSPAPAAGPLPADITSIQASSAPAGTSVVAQEAAPAAPAGPMMGQSTTEVETYEGPSASGIAQWNSATEQQKVAAAESHNALRMENAAKVASAQRVITETARFEEQERTRQMELEKRQADWQARVDQAEKSYAGTSVDSGRLWRDSSTGSKIAGGIGVMLGALGQALTGKDNTALKVINHAIERDIDIQKENMDKAGKQAAGVRNAYSDFLKATGDEQAARAAIHNLALTNIQADLNLAIAKTADTTAAANLTKHNADIDAEKAKNLATISTVKNTKTVETTPVKVAKEAPPGATYWNETTGTEMENRTIAIDMVDDILTSLDDPKIGDMAGPVDSAFLNTASQWGFEVPEEYTEYKGRTGLLVTAILKRMSGQGVTESEYNRWRDLLPTVRDNPDNARAKAREFMRLEREAYDTVLEKKAKNIVDPTGQRIFRETFAPKLSKQAAGFKPN